MDWHFCIISGYEIGQTDLQKDKVSSHLAAIQIHDCSSWIFFKYNEAACDDGRATVNSNIGELFLSQGSKISSPLLFHIYLSFHSSPRKWNYYEAKEKNQGLPLTPFKALEAFMICPHRLQIFIKFLKSSILMQRLLSLFTLTSPLLCWVGWEELWNIF